MTDSELVVGQWYRMSDCLIKECRIAKYLGLGTDPLNKHVFYFPNWSKGIPIPWFRVHEEMKNHCHEQRALYAEEAISAPEGYL